MRQYPAYLRSKPTVGDRVVANLIGQAMAIPSAVFVAFVGATADAPTWGWLTAAVITLEVIADRSADRLLNS